MKRVRARATWLVAFLLALPPSLSCKKGAPPSASATSFSPVVRDDSTGQLLTWIDDKGDFHVATAVADVPLMGRDTVRVVDPDASANPPSEPGAPDRVFVVDLRQPRSDGTYPVRPMGRADFEAIAVARREQAGPTLAHPAPPGSAEATEQPPAVGQPSPSARAASVRGAVVIYGAEWCGACHEAARYLRRKGVPYVEKDVEKDANAAAEMQQKLAKNALHAGSIPVIDVRGKIMVGFNAAEIDAALGERL